MNPSEFAAKIDAHPDLAFDFVDRETHRAVIKHEPTQTLWGVGAGAVVGNAWQDLEDVLTCKREPKILAQMTRIVGYYSSVNNWNKSKLGELADRRKGDYRI